jgi:acyl-CoA reductase-like NAD-dependent aldehyde dehydrogenase
MDARRELAASGRRLRGVLSWRAWTDDAALAVLQWIDERDLPATAAAALTVHGRLASEVAQLEASLRRLRQPAGSRVKAREVEELLKQAIDQLEQHDAEFYEYAPLFPYVEAPGSGNR